MRSRPLLTALAILVTALAVSPAGRAQDTTADLVGAWSAQEDYYRATILFEREAAGSLRGFFADDDLQPGAALSSVTVRGDSVFFEASQVGAQFRGAFTADGPSIRGTYMQGSASVSLTLVRATATQPPPETAARRPQHPTEYPYISEDVSFGGEPSGVRLAGTLTVPEGPGPHPAVVLVPGSGDNDRDFEVYGHRPFLVLADHLTRRGIAVLRYDERGVGGSGGDPHLSDFDDEGQDVAAAVRFLQARPEIDAQRVGLVGHSLGGVTVPYVHETLERAAFLVLLMAPAIPLQGLLVEQNSRLAAAYGASETEAEARRAVAASMFEAAGADTDSLTAAVAIGAAYDASGRPAELREATVRAHTAQVFRDLMRYDPRPPLERLDVPVLAVYGRADLAVTPEENAGPMEAALAASRSGDVTVRILDRLNHFLQPSETGLDDEAAASDVTVASDLLDLIAAWVAERAELGE